MKTRNIIPALICAFTLAGCSLEEYPYGFYSGSNFPSTEGDAESSVLYIYDAINYIEYSRTIVFLGDMNTDELNPKNDAAQSTHDIDKWRMSNFRSNTALGNFFKYSYITVNRANAVIRQVPEMNIKQEFKDRYVGEAYFMRAYSYFNLAKNFGLVPIHKIPVETLADTYTALPANLDELWEFIISDLRTACGLLDYYAVPETGRADLAAAQGLLSKAYLYIASAKHYGVPQYTDMKFDMDEYYGYAKEYAGYVVDNALQATYGFEENLLDIYDVDKPAGPEHIFIMSMDRSGKSEGQYSKISKMYIPYLGGNFYIRNEDDGATLLHTHDGWGEYQTNLPFYNSYEAGDRRHDWLIVDKVYNEDGTVLADVDGTSGKKLSYPFCRKYIDPEFIGDKTSTKPYLLRFSDIALVYAEAAGPTDKAYSLVNRIRERAGLGALPAGMSVEEFREAVIRERQFELAFEGNLCYDLRRTNRLHTDVSYAAEQGLTAEEMVFYPLPSIETDLNLNINTGKTTDKEE